MSLPSKVAKTPLDGLILQGTPVTATKSGAASAIKAMLYDGDGDILLATGAAVPADTSTGYAKGCLFIDTDVATGTTGLYCNKGVNTSCVFTAVTQA